MNKHIVCALAIGHTEQSPGARNIKLAVTEFCFNHALSKDIQNATHNVTVIRVYRDLYRDLPDKINQLNPDFIISLHCNAYNRATSGTEVMYYHTSKQGKILARLLQHHFLSALHLNNRGMKPITSEGRGGYLLRYTHSPCVIAEPFFVDNPHDLQHALRHRNKLVNAYVQTIHAFAKQLNHPTAEKGGR